MMWGMGSMWLWGLILVAAVVIAVVWAARAMGAAPSGRESPEEILKRRYVRGEIDRPEYEHRLGDVRK